MQRYTAREKYLISNTLNCLPVLLQGRAVLLDLRNETSAAGIISSADGHMNCELTHAVFIDRNGRYYPFDYLMIRNRMIRQLHVPADFDVGKEVLQQQSRRAERPKTNTKRTFKQKRAEVRHQETLDHINRQKQDEKANNVQSNQDTS